MNIYRVTINTVVFCHGGLSRADATEIAVKKWTLRFGDTADLRIEVELVSEEIMKKTQKDADIIRLIEEGKPLARF